MIWDIILEDWLLMTVTILAVIGVAVRLHVYHSYRRLVSESTHPATSKHFLMKTLYHKFTACYQLKIGVGNVDSFVDRQVKSYKTGGLYLLSWEQFSKVPLVLAVFLTILGYMRIYANNGTQLDLFHLSMVGVSCAGMQVIFLIMLDVRGKKEILSANLKDYLDNGLKVKLEQDYIYPELLKDYNEEKQKSAVLDREDDSVIGTEIATIKTVKRPSETEKQQPTAVRVPSRRRDEAVIRKELVQAVQSVAATREQQIIDDILKEYLS